MNSVAICVYLLTNLNRLIQNNYNSLYYNEQQHEKFD